MAISFEPTPNTRKAREFYHRVAAERMRPLSRRRYLSVASSLLTSATTISPSRAVSVRFTRAKSPSKMPASIIESPDTSSA